MKLTLKEAGEVLGTDERSIINWGKGRTVPKVYRLPSIIRFLGYNPLPEPRTIAERLVGKRLELGWSRKVASPRHLEMNRHSGIGGMGRLFSFGSTDRSSQKCSAYQNEVDREMKSDGKTRTDRRERRAVREYPPESEIAARGKKRTYAIIIISVPSHAVIFAEGELARTQRI